MKKNLIFILTLSLMVSLLGVAGASYNFGGETVRIGFQRAAHYANPNPETAAHLEWVEETFNVKLEFKSTGFQSLVDDVMAGVLAGDAEYDLLSLQTPFAYELIANGVFRPLGGILANIGYWDNISHVYPDREYAEFAGQYYLFNAALRIGWGVVWNKGIFERYGLPNLYDLYESGDWTWDAFKQIAIQATRDTTGDGEIDLFGWSTRNNSYYSYPPVDPPRSAYDFNDVIYFLGMNNTPIVKNVDGRMVFNLDSLEAIETYRFLQELYEEGTMPPPGVHGSHAFADGRLAMNLDYNFGLGFARDRLEEDYGFVPFPKGPNAEEHTSVERMTYAVGIPITTNFDSEALIALMDAIEEYSYDYTDDQFIIDDLYEFLSGLVRDRESLDYLLWATENVEVSKYYNILFVPEFTIFSSNIIWGGESPEAAIAAVKESAQIRLDMIFGQ